MNCPKKNHTWVKTFIDLEALIGVNRHTISTYFRKDGAPKKTKRGFRLDQCIKFIAGTTGSFGVLAKVDPALRSLKEREIQARVAKLEFENEVARGHYVLRSTVDADIRTAMEILKSELAGISTEVGSAFGEIGPQVEKLVSERIRSALLMASQKFEELARE